MIARHDCGFPGFFQETYPTLSGMLEGLRILVLEDEFLIAMDVEQLCRDHGAVDVTVARSLEEIGEGLDVDAAIIDVLLNGVSTLDFAAGLEETGIPSSSLRATPTAARWRSGFPMSLWSGNPIRGTI